jgi:hypothetical protein
MKQIDKAVIALFFNCSQNNEVVPRKKLTPEKTNKTKEKRTKTFLLKD